MNVTDLLLFRLGIVIVIVIALLYQTLFGRLFLRGGKGWSIAITIAITIVSVSVFVGFTHDNDERWGWQDYSLSLSLSVGSDLSSQDTSYKN